MLNKLENNILISILLLAMFFVSGITKIATFNETVASIQKRFTIITHEKLHQMITILVVLLEIIAPILIINYFINKTAKDYAYYSTLALAIFTIIATFIYHYPDFSSYKRSIAFWANISLLGGLLLLAKHIRSEL